MRLNKNILGLILGPILFLVIMIFVDAEGLSFEAKCILASTAWMAIWWVTECVPISVTALLPIVLFPLTGGMDLSTTTAAYGHKLVFLFVGEVLLNLLGVDINSFAVAGSIIILFLAADMILGVKLYKDSNPKTASIVPIAFPLIAGPGTLTTLISIKSEYNDINIILAIVLNMILVYIVLKSSEKIQKILGSQGINILRKVFGIILLAIGIKLFTTNIKLIFA